MAPGERNPVANRVVGAPGAEVSRRGGASRVALAFEHAARRAYRENGRDRFVDAAAEGEVELNVAGFDGDVDESGLIQDPRDACVVRQGEGARLVRSSFRWRRDMSGGDAHGLPTGSARPPASRRRPAARRGAGR